MTAPPSIEDRLRATLVAEADRHPVTPDLAGLRDRAEGGVVVDLRAAPRRNRARILAAAAVLAVVALGVVAVARGTGDEGQPVASGTGGPTGWYLPGEGFEITSVALASTVHEWGTTREVWFAPDTEDPMRTLSARVVRVRSADLPERWVGAATDPVVVLDVGATSSGTSEEDMVTQQLIQVVAQRPGELLVIDTDAEREAEALALVTRWQESDGRDVVLDPTSDLVAWRDRTWTDVAPVTPEQACGLRCVSIDDRGPLDPLAGAIGAEAPMVHVQVRSPLGTFLEYTLRPPGTGGRPTGPEADDVWELDRATVGAGGVGRFADGADVEVLTGVPGVPSAFLPPRSEALDLVRGLRPVDRDTWAAAASGIGSEPVAADAWGATLASTPLPDPAADTGATTTSEVGPTETTEVPTTTAARDGAWEESTSRRVRDALTALATDGTVDDLFADEVTVGFVGDTDADSIVPLDQLAERETWVLELGGRWGHTGPVSALDLVAEAAAGEGLSAGILSVPVLSCSQGGAAADPGYVAVSMGPIGAGCDRWFSVVAHLDEQDRITQVRVVLDPETVR